MATFDVEVVTPERTLLDGEAEMVTLRSAGGDIAYLAGHVPYIGAVLICVARVHRPGGAVEAVSVHGGFIEVVDGKVVLLAGVAERAGDIDAERARRALQAAEGAGDEDAVRRAEVRLESAEAAAR
ncbi:MAG: ATP synthase F1 subunit epsilon [Acidimicrobiales bacterium]